jgi:hypothetical protein
VKLQDHLDLLGQDARMFAFHTKLPDAVIQRALTGQPIAAPHAERIAEEITKRHGLHWTRQGDNAQAIKVEDIDGLVVVKPHELKSKKGNQ